MIDWGEIGKIAGGGFGVTMLVLVILSLVAWIVGWIVQKTVKNPVAGKEK